MRFLQSEYQAIQQAIGDHGFTSEAFSFVKRKGRLHIVHHDTQAAFVFFRKTETQLNA